MYNVFDCQKLHTISIEKKKNCLKITYDACCPYHRGQIEWLLCCSPFVNSIHLHGRVIALRWSYVRSFRPFWVLMLVRWIQDVFVSENGTTLTLLSLWSADKFSSLFSILQFVLRSTSTKWPVEYFVVQTSLQFGKFPPPERRTSWLMLGICELVVGETISTIWLYLQMLYLCTFSINWKLVPRSWIFFTLPGVSLLANLHSTWPSRKMSSYWPDGTFSPNTSNTHFKTSASCSLLRG